MTMLLLALRGGGTAQRLSIDAYLRECRCAAVPTVAMLSALRFEKPVDFAHGLRAYVVAPDDPQLYQHTYDDLVLGGTISATDVSLLPPADDQMPVWRVPVRFDLPGYGRIGVRALSCSDAEAIVEAELARCRKLRGAPLAADPFFKQLTDDVEGYLNDCFHDYVSEVTPHHIAVGPSDLPVLPAEPDDVELEWVEPP